MQAIRDSGDTMWWLVTRDGTCQVRWKAFSELELSMLDEILRLQAIVEAAEEYETAVSEWFLQYGDDDRSDSAAERLESLFDAVTDARTKLDAAKGGEA